MYQGDSSEGQLSAAYDSLKNIQTKDSKGGGMGKAILAAVIILVIIIIAAVYIYENGGLGAFAKYTMIPSAASTTTISASNSVSNQIIEGALGYSSAGASDSQSNAQSLDLSIPDGNGDYICAVTESNSTATYISIVNSSIANYYSDKQYGNQSAVMCSPGNPSKDYGPSSDIVVGVYNYTTMRSSGANYTSGQHYYNVTADYYSKDIVVIAAVCYKNECALTAPQGCTSVQDTTTQSTAAIAYVCKNQEPGKYTFDVSSPGGTGIDAEAFVFYK